MGIDLILCGDSGIKLRIFHPCANQTIKIAMLNRLSRNSGTSTQRLHDRFIETLPFPTRALLQLAI